MLDLKCVVRWLIEVGLLLSLLPSLNVDLCCAGVRVVLLCLYAVMVA